MKSMRLRVARATNLLHDVSEMYRRGLDLQVLASFRGHAGFDGVILGDPSCDYHLEFTQEADRRAPDAASDEDLIVFYVPNRREWSRLAGQMEEAGFKRVLSHNPYWDEDGATFEDLEGYRVVLTARRW